MNIFPLAWLLLLGAAPTGVVVESVDKGTPADAAGLRAGDVFVSWRAAPGRELREVPGGGPLSSPFDLEYVEIEVAPRLPVVLSGLRGGQPLEVRVEGGEWKARSRPLGVDERPTFEAAEAAAAQDDRPLACWLVLRLAEQAPPEADGDVSDWFALAGDVCTPEGRPGWVAVAQQDLARALQARQHFFEAEAAWRDAIRRWDDTAPRSLGAAAAGHGLGTVFFDRGLPNDAEPFLRRALSLREELAPAGLEVAATLHSLGLVASWQSDLASASAWLTRALELRRRLAPRSLLVPETLLSLGTVVNGQGNAAQARGLMREALTGASIIEPDGLLVGTIEIDLGNIAWTVGDVAAAEDHYRRSLAIAEKVAPQSRLITRVLNNLANVAMARGDSEAAESLFGRAVVVLRVHWPDSLFTAGVLANLGDCLADQGRFAEAQAVYREALEVGQRAAPRSETVAFILHNVAELSLTLEDQAGLGRYVPQLLERVEGLAPRPLVGHAYRLGGELALAQGNLADADDWLRKAIALMEKHPLPEAGLAAAYRGLAKLEQKRGRATAAADAYRKAVDALESLRGRLGGSGSGRLGFGVRHAQLYQEAIEALLEIGRPEEAFHYLERSRARALLEMMAERDMALDAAIASPQPLDVENARRAFDAEGAFLAYSVGQQRTVLFVLAPGRPGAEARSVEALVLPLGSKALRTRIAAWRRMAEKSVPPPEFFAEGRALYDALIRPAEPFIASARRLVFGPDGPLHHLPFAALRRDGAYLVEWKPLALVPSASVLAQLIQSRPVTPGAPSLVAFGDPQAPGVPALAGSRREIAAIRSLFPRSQVFLGAEATKPQMEAVAKGFRYVHFAGHGVLDERRPLESALALSPAPGASGHDDGRLHAWEIFERMRLHADLLTLSACRSAAGTELAGEGLLGLTRAFHYAGARSVVASLWSVPDKSTPLFMRRFYGGLKEGLAKDDALRRAQRAAIRAGHHPLRWASFQLYGDWR